MRRKRFLARYAVSLYALAKSYGCHPHTLLTINGAEPHELLAFDTAIMLWANAVEGERQYHEKTKSKE